MAVPSLFLQIASRISPRIFALPGGWVYEVSPDQMLRILAQGRSARIILFATAVFFSTAVATAIAPRARWWVWLMFPLVLAIHNTLGVYSAFAQYGHEMGPFVALTLLANSTGMIVGAAILGHLATKLLRHCVPVKRQ